MDTFHPMDAHLVSFLPTFLGLLSDPDRHAVPSLASSPVLAALHSICRHCIVLGAKQILIGIEIRLWNTMLHYCLSDSCDCNNV